MTETTEVKQGSFSAQLLKEEQRGQYEFVVRRIQQLQDVRKNHYGHNLDTIWAEADRDYIPHRLNAKTKNKRVTATDEEKGWRGQLVSLGTSDWQSDISQSNPFIKIQTALSLLIDQNPSGVFTAIKKQYQATTELIKQLYQRSWEYAKSKGQLKLFIFNLAKYGWACARTYPLKVTRKVKVLKEYNPEDPSKSVYEEKEVIEFNDVMRENLDPRNVWMDDMARPNNALSVRDWCFRKIYDMEDARTLYGKYDFFKYVQAGGNTEETIGLSPREVKKHHDTEARELVEMYGYENRAKDLFMVLMNGVPVVIEPLPVSDNQGLKKLSLWQTYWNLRHAESPYGVGIYEAIRFDQGMLDRFRNMTIDQLTLAIYKMFFYQGTQSLTETGDIVVKPGVGKQVLDPKNVTWLEVPGPGQESWLGIDMLRMGITSPPVIDFVEVKGIERVLGLELFKLSLGFVERFRRFSFMETHKKVPVAVCGVVF